MLRPDPCCLEFLTTKVFLKSLSMGQCCQGAKLDGGTNTDGSPRKKLSLGSFKSSSNKSKRSKSKSDKSHSPKHHPLPDHQSSGSQTPNNPNTNATFGNPSSNYDDNINDDEYDEDDEEIDLSVFQEDVVDFIEFWHQHFENLSKESIHNALVRRVHNKVQGILNRIYSLPFMRNFALHYMPKPTNQLTLYFHLIMT